MEFPRVQLVYITPKAKKKLIHLPPPPYLSPSLLERKWPALMISFSRHLLEPARSTIRSSGVVGVEKRGRLVKVEITFCIIKYNIKYSNRTSRGVSAVPDVI